MPPMMRLRKCLYGLPHAPATFRAHIDEVLRIISTVSDQRSYVRLHDDGIKVFFTTASTTALKNETMVAMQEVFKCVEGDLGFTLGMKLIRD